MPGRIFINYRRDDDPGTVGRLFDRLEKEFGRSEIFMDVEGSIRAGDDFVDVLRAQVERCDVLLAVIGPRWLTAKDDDGHLRLHNPNDWVRVEIVSALQGGGTKRVIPVLTGDIEMPREGELPAEMTGLTRRQYVRVSQERFHADATRLVDQVKGALADISGERAAVERERLRAEQEEIERSRREEKGEQDDDAEGQRQWSALIQAFDAGRFDAGGDIDKFLRGNPDFAQRDDAKRVGSIQLRSAIAVLCLSFVSASIFYYAWASDIALFEVPSFISSLAIVLALYVSIFAAHSIFSLHAQFRSAIMLSAAAGAGLVFVFWLVSVTPTIWNEFWNTIGGLLWDLAGPS